MQIIKIYILLFLSVLVSTFSYADNDPEDCSGTDNPKAEKYFKKAGELYSKDSQKAREFVLKALQEDEDYVDAWYMLADFTMQNYDKAWNNPRAQKKLRTDAHRYLMRVLDLCPKYDNYRLNFTVGEAFYRDKDYIKALEYLEIYIKHGDKKDNTYSEAKEMVKEIKFLREMKKHPVPFDPEPVEGISTNNDEYLPLLSPDGELMFYTHRFLKQNYNSIYGDEMTEEFTVSNRADSTYMHYVEARAMQSPFNKGSNQGGISITIDNSCLFVTLCEYVSSDYKNCDIYISHRTYSGWTALENLGPNVNGKWTWESQPSISPNGKTLYFASIRPENMGSDDTHQTSDIYYTELLENGSWAKAKNIGKPLNTDGNEKSPFFHADNRTLYFSSDRHQGLGGYDIFFSQNVDNIWQEPKNIGYPINTEKDDLGFIVNTRGNRAYFSSNKLNGNGGYDIYGFQLYKEARPDKVLFVKGQLVNEQGEAITEARVEVMNTETQEISEGMVDDETGNYAVALRIDEEKDDENFLMVVKKENSSFTSRYIDTEKANSEEPTTMNVEIQPIETGQSVKLHDINFDFALDALQDKSLIVLDNFVDFLKENPKLTFEIHGHTDNVGNDNTNLLLSQNRAKTVYNYLLNKGISASRMNYQGYGESRPIATNETEEGRAQNRRTEFFIVDNY